MKLLILLTISLMAACNIEADKLALHYLDPSCSYEYLTNAQDYTYKTYKCETKQCVEFFTLEDEDLLNGRVVCLENPEVK